MGRPKLGLPLGGRTVLEWVISAFRGAGVEHILVVLGPHVADLAALAQEAGAQVHLLPDETADMRATVEAGLGWLEENLHPRAGDAWLLAPGDHPTLGLAVIGQLIAAWTTRPSSSLIIPTYQGKRGHPALVDWKHVAGIRGLAPGLGLNTYFREQSWETLELPVACPGIVTDLDTPEEYQRLLREWPLEKNQGGT
jgi:molybdenum cofactor cytidylyltransferase